MGLLAFCGESLKAFGEQVRNFKSVQDFFTFLSFTGIIGLLFFGRQLYKTGRLYIQYRDIGKDIQQIGTAVLYSLNKAGYITTNLSSLEVRSVVDNHGAVSCYLEGGSTYEKSIFVNSIIEIIGPVDNPKYVIIRKSNGFFMKHLDYHTVPELIGRNKKNAEYFKKEWTKLVGNCELVYTRTPEGRKLILKSRVKSLAAQFESKAEHVNIWR
jgi:hypothetical protein